MKKVRVLFLPPVDSGNTNAQSLNTREIALRLNVTRFKSTLLYTQTPDSRVVGHEGIRLVRLPQRGKTWAVLKEQLSEHDLVAYLDFSPASYVFVHLPRILRGKTKTVLHAEAPSAQLVNPSARLRFLYDGIVPRCDVCTGITDFVARDFARLLGRKIEYVLPVGVDTRFFRPPADRNHAAVTVLFCGTLIERKGPQHVLDAAARFPRANFHLAGAGRDSFESVLHQKLVELNLHNVTFLGPKSQPEVLNLMQQSDIFLLPSHLEGIPKVTLEAAATGLPCVVFRDYETPSVVDGRTGFQVGTLEEMFDRLRQLIADSTLRKTMGAAARQHAEKFDWDVITKQWEDAYLRIALGGGC